MSHAASPFLSPGARTQQHDLAILQLKRDHLLPTIISTSGDNPAPAEENDGRNGEETYKKGRVCVSRFGFFPHSTLVNQPWGVQVRASEVDTGSRGTKSKKRKREDIELGGNDGAGRQLTEEERASLDADRDGCDITGNILMSDGRAVPAPSGFTYLLPPTPERWSQCLPHRTQVVYPRDYSYILQKMRVRPGDHVIECGAGSGSFTHAAARAVYNGVPNGAIPEEASRHTPGNVQESSCESKGDAQDQKEEAKVGDDKDDKEEASKVIRGEHDVRKKTL